MSWFTIVVLAWTGLAIVTLISLVTLKIRAPYGRHANEKWGAMIDNKIGWIVMELPALLIFPLLAVLGPQEMTWFTWLLVGLWSIHYINRTIVFPLRIKTKGKKMPLAIVFSALFFNGMNGFINGYFIGYIFVMDEGIHLYDLNIIIGLFVFVLGMWINHKADTKLISLRKENLGYQIPRGWLFKYVSCPNHLGEIIEWFGFAIVAWSLPALSFAIWTFCNLVPRTLNHHEWYFENFSDYPKNRKAVIPFIW